MTEPKAAKALLVLGMHRSGTSVATRVLNLLGVELGSDMIPPAADNPLGFWEHRGVVEVHEELLESLGRTWHDVRPLPVDWLSTAAASIARVKLVELLQREFADIPLWAVKDPRLCRLLPLWQLVLDDLNVTPHAVFVVRHPDEVAQSLFCRDGISVEQTRLLWLQHFIEAEQASRGMRREVISYDALLRDRLACMQRLGDHFALEWSAGDVDVQGLVNQFINPQQRHHTSNGSSFGALPGLVLRTYEAFTVKAKGGKSWDAIVKLSDLYSSSAEVFLDDLGVMADRLQTSEIERRRLAAETSRLQEALDGLTIIAKENDAVGHFRKHLNEQSRITDCAKIYFRGTNEEYSEEKSVSIRHEGLYDPARLNFELPGAAEIAFVRFDPSEFPGEYHINEVCINGKSVPDLATLVSSQSGQVIASGPTELRVTSADSDPYVELDISRLAGCTDDMLSIELTCCRSTLRTELSQLIEKLLANNVLAIQAMIAEGVDTIRPSRKAAFFMRR